MFFDDLFGPGDVPVLAIMRGYAPDDAVALARRAWSLGVRAVEVPLQRPADLDTLRAVVEAGRETGMPVGSGTVISAEQVETTRRLGGVFTVAPGFSPEVARESERLGVPHLPGVATASEIQQALGAGLDWMKAFPASVLGPAWFGAMRGPFPDVKFAATGGMSAANAADYLRAGARVISLGSALASRDAFGLIERLASAG
jgi:2-dehydro-3-deoxyphosphogluconate aldolase/(4S)-4-hydroxy-2-oxoglutarate aldolase